MSEALEHLAEICGEHIAEGLERSAELRAQAGKLRGELKAADEYIEQLEEEIADLRCSYNEALHQLSKLRRAAVCCASGSITWPTRPATR